MYRSKPRFDVSEGYRSGLENEIAAQLNEAGVAFEYESERIPYRKTHHYIPDFRLPNGVFIEGKGRFTAADRAKLKAVRQQNPDIDIRLVFSRSSSRLSKTSKTTYGQWCEQHGFPYADKHIPTEWLQENA